MLPATFARTPELEKGNANDLVLSQGTRYLGRQAGLAVAIDLVMIALFAWYLQSVRAAQKRTSQRREQISV
jgi:hypothetical protein